MDYDRFVSNVEQRAQSPDKEAAVNSIRATLETLAERIGGDAARHLASQLPAEIGQYLEFTRGMRGERFSFDEFCQRVAARENYDTATSRSNATAVIETLEEAITDGELSDLMATLPQEYMALFVAERHERIPR